MRNLSASLPVFLLYSDSKSFPCLFTHSSSFSFTFSCLYSLLHLCFLPLAHCQDNRLLLTWPPPIPKPAVPLCTRRTQSDFPPHCLFWPSLPGLRPAHFSHLPANTTAHAEWSYLMLLVLQLMQISCTSSLFDMDNEHVCLTHRSTFQRLIPGCCCLHWALSAGTEHHVQHATILLYRDVIFSRLLMF